MTFYHFCAGEFLESIKKEGLTEGQIPNGDNSFTPGFQWLTIHQTYNQSWCRADELQYNRTEYRLTIDIPESESRNVLKWVDHFRGHPMFNDLNNGCDPQHWFLFKGTIPPDWIKLI